MTDVSNTDDIIDSRDIIARIEELEAELEGGTLDEKTNEYVMVDDDGDEINMDDEYEELEVLKVLAEEAENCCSWEDGETLISDNYFEQYAVDFAEDIGAVGSEDQWPLQHIDWKAAAADLQTDYSSVDYDGQTFWVRSS
jgi:hypothetical protein